VLEDPRRRPYVVFWRAEGGGVATFLTMAAAENGNAVLVTLENSGPHRIAVLRRPLPRGTGTALFYRCPVCQKPRRYLYLLTRSGDQFVDDFGLRCQVCAGLRFRSQGRHIKTLWRTLVTAFHQGRRTSEPFPRHPWDPRAVSDPRLVAKDSPLRKGDSKEVGHCRTSDEKRVARYLRALRRRQRDGAPMGSVRIVDPD
jgi:hypothetical protein